MLGPLTDNLSKGAKGQCAPDTPSTKEIKELEEKLKVLDERVTQNEADIASPDINKVNGTFENVDTNSITSVTSNTQVSKASEVRTNTIKPDDDQPGNLELTHDEVHAKHIDAETINAVNITANITDSDITANSVSAKNFNADVVDAAIVDTDDLRVLNKMTELSVANLEADTIHTPDITANSALITETLTSVGAHIDNLMANNADITHTSTGELSADAASISSADINTLYTAGHKGSIKLAIDTTLPVSDVVTLKVPVISGYYVIRNTDFSLTIFVNKADEPIGDLKPAVFVQLSQGVIGNISEIRYSKDENIYVYYKRPGKLRENIEYSYVSVDSNAATDITYQMNNYAPETQFTVYPDTYNFVGFLSKTEDLSVLLQGRFKATASEIGKDIFVDSIGIKDRATFSNPVTKGYDTIIVGGFDVDKKEPTLNITNKSGLRVEGTTVLDNDFTVNGTAYFKGDIMQEGKPYETHAEQVFTKEAMIVTRDGATKELNPGELTGIKAEHYDPEGNNGILAFDNTGTARVGDEGFEQPIATRSEAKDMENASVVSWSSAENKLITSKEPLIYGHRIAKTDEAFMLTGAEGMDNIPSEYTSLDQVLKAGQYAVSTDSEKYIGKPAGETGPYDLTVGYFNTDKSKPYQIYYGKVSEKIYYRITNGDDVEGNFTLWKRVINDVELTESLTEESNKWKAADAAIIDGTTPVQKVALDATDAKGDKLATVKDVRTASWVGTKAKFDADKEIKDPDSKDFIADGTLINLLDDPSDTLNLSNSVTEGDLQPVTSNAVALYDPTPVGTIIYSVAKKEPKGYLRCDGREISSTQYPELYSVLEFSFDPEGKRCLLPNQLTADGKPRALYGADSGTYKVGTYIEESLPNHSHTYTDPGHIHGMKAQGTTTSGSGGSFNVQEGDFGATTNAKTNITIDGVDNVYNALGEKIENTVYKDNANVFSNGIAVNMFIKF